MINQNSLPKNSIQEIQVDNSKLKESFQKALQGESELKKELRKLSYKSLIECLFEATNQYP